MLDHGNNLDLRAVLAAVTARLVASARPYEVLEHGTRAVSLLCHNGGNQVGLTLWPSGDAEMTWAMEETRGGHIQHYELGSRSDLIRLLTDLESRLIHY